MLDAVQDAELAEDAVFDEPTDTPLDSESGGNNAEEAAPSGESEALVEVELDEPDQPPRKGKGAPGKPLPNPPRFNCDLQQFVRYQWDLHNGKKWGHIKIYAYGLWPVRDVLLPLPKDDQDRIRKLWAQKKRAIDAPLKSYPVSYTEEPLNSKNPMLDIMQRFGSGDYNFQLKDTRPGFKKLICMCTVQTPRDYDQYPPNVEAGEIVLTDPKNESYLRWARARGIHFPGDPGFKQDDEEQSDMAEVKMITSLLAEGAKEARQEAREARQELRQELRKPVKEEAGGMSQVFLTMIQTQQEQTRLQIQQQADHNAAMLKMTQDSSNTQMAMLAERVKVAEAKANTPAPTPPAAPDPLVQLKVLADVMASMRPAPVEKPAEDPVVKILMQQMEANERRAAQDREFAQRQIDAQNTRIAESEKANRELLMKQVAPENNGTLKMIREFNTVREAFLGESGGPENPWVTALTELGPKAMETVSDVARSYATATAANAARPAPAPPVVLNSTAIPAGQQQHQRAPTEEEKQMSLMEEIAARIHRPLLDALRNGMPGYEFAARMNAEFGGPIFTMVYNPLLKGGRDAVLNDGGLLNLKTPAGVQRYGEMVSIGAPRIEQFVAEFLDLAKVNETTARATGQQATQAPPPQAAPPQPQVPPTTTTTATPPPTPPRAQMP